MRILFPHDEPREPQKDLILKILTALEEKHHVITHAPTGLGKTAAAIAPALTYAIEKDKTIFFLTSRHTQHKIAIDTLQKIKERHAKDFIVTDIIGKKNMCLQKGVENLYTSEFFEYCKALREDGSCEYYVNTYSSNDLTIDARKLMNDLMVKGISTTDHIKQESRTQKRPLCPYEMSQQLSKEARVIVADYYYIFNNKIRESFLGKINKKLEDCIIIVDEAHNLPERIRELLTVKLSSTVLKNAAKEADDFSFNEIKFTINKLMQLLDQLQLEMKTPEEKVRKEVITELVNSIGDYDQVLEDLATAADEVREEKKRSSIGTIHEFLERWNGKDEGFIRYLKRDENTLSICYRCLDPSLMSQEVIDTAHSVIMMSGTLNPTKMYQDLLGFRPETTTIVEYPSPFPEKNRLNLIIPETTTKFSARDPAQFRRMGEICAEIGNKIQGNIAIFFPSYYLKELVRQEFIGKYEKTVFAEMPGMSTEEKKAMIERFKGYKEHGSALLGVASGSYGEGIDLPGDLLKAVIVVGLPLTKPDLETKELIAYYDNKFGKGWDYGYTFPAFNKILQNAGRCIRTEEDKGIVVFLDERFAWNNYLRCFPSDMKYKITKQYKEEIVDFFW